MARLIDADKLRKDVLDLPDCCNGFSDTYDKARILDLIDEQPTADAVEVVSKNETTTEVVRCKDCVYCKRFNDVWYLPKRDELLCTLYVEKYHTTENDYCSWGERREDADN